MVNPVTQQSAPSIWSLVLIPAIITLVVSIIRLTGELQGWSALWFGREVDAAGEVVTKQSALVGIAWLVPLFGAYFGYRLAARGEHPTALKSALLFLTASVVVGGGVVLFYFLGLVTFPDASAESPADPEGLIYFLGMLFVGIVIGLFAWRRLALTLLLYAFLARIPVMIITWICLTAEWDTHYTELPPGIPQSTGFALLTDLCLPQCTVWIGFTVLIGGLFGAIGNWLGSRSQAGRTAG